MDIIEVAALLSIIEKCVGHPGRFNNIVSEATNKLLAINANLEPKPPTQLAKEPESWPETSSPNSAPEAPSLKDRALAAAAASPETSET